jgi:hypothetical protein
MAGGGFVMYQIRCDDRVLYDPRDDALTLTAPRCKMEVNTVGEASFTIHATHPEYSNIHKLRSIIEILQDGQPIFRGRVTGDTLDFDNSSAVDVEGVLAFLNDSIVRPYAFPDDVKDDPGYIAAAESGNVIEFYLAWMLERHNAQVDDFQKLKLGSVTVTDPNNYLSRSSSEYATTWKEIEGKLFGSALGGYFCIRYESDGNYVDYLSDFELTNTQRISFGENLLDLTSESDATGTYTAILPLGATLENSESRLTVSELEDGSFSEDIVKSGDMLYSISARAQYGLIFAPPEESTWDDVKTAVNLRRKAAETLSGKGRKLSSAITAKAVDLNFTDSEIASFRMYRYVNIDSAPHNRQGRYMLTVIDLDIENPQNTVFTFGEKKLTLTDANASDRKEMSEQIESIKVKTEQQITESEKRTETKIVTTVQQTCESFVYSVLSSYVGESEYEQYKEMIQTQLALLSNQLEISITRLMSEISNVDGDLQEKYNEITKYFTFDINGLTIGQVDNPYKIVIDNDRYSMLVNDVEVMWIADGEVYTPEITVTKKMSLLGYMLSEDDAGRVNCEYVGG